MLGMCYPHHDSLMQPKNEQKRLNLRFYGFIDKLLLRAGDMNNYFAQSSGFFFNQHGMDFYEFREVCEYISHDSGVPLLDCLWKHVLTTTGGSESETSQLYKAAVARVETQARAVYVEEDISCFSKDEFVEGMTGQGCFILLIALCSLCGPKLLGYPPDHQIFGDKQENNETIRDLVHVLVFCTQSQIPLVVLKVLMKQSFFQNILKKGKWKRPYDLAGMILYDFLVEPMLLLLDDHDPVPKNHQGNISLRRSLPRIFHRRNHRWHQEQQPATLLHALWLLLTGPQVGGSFGKDVEGDHLYPTFTTVSGAKELQAAGITFKSYGGLGTRQIKFKKRMLDANLYLPCIYLEPYTMTLFKILIHYEQDVNLDIDQREVSAYVCFINELIRSHDDAKVLVTAGIIGSDPNYEENLQSAFSNLASASNRLVVGNSHNFAAIRRQIGRYVKPSMKTKIVNLVLIGVLLTLLQTIYSMLSYHHPPH